MSGADYSKAQWLPSPNFWAGNDAFQLIVVHATASGGPQTGYQLATSTEFTDGQSKSVHYINDVDGTVYQIVNEVNSAWGNCCATGASPYDHVYNWNKKSISIENVKHSSDNSEPLTAAQYQSLLSLIRDICQRRNIPLQAGTPTSKGIIFHHDLDPVNKSRCPSTFPYATFFQDLGGSPVTTATKVKTNSAGCVAETAFWYQLSEGEMNTCGPTSAAVITKSVAPNVKLSATTEDIDVLTDAIIQDVFGISDPKQFQGVDTWDHDMTNIMKYLAKKAGNVHFQVVSTMQQLEAAVRSGYPCLYGCNELDLFQWDNTDGWVHPYTWQLSAGHILGLVGLDQNGNWITADPLNNAVHIPIYRRSAIANSFSGGMIVQLTNWLAPIPDIHNWPANFNAQQKVSTPPMTLSDNQLKAFKAEVLSIVPSLSFSSRIMGQVTTDYMAGKFRGPALCMEYLGKDWNGTTVTVMCFAGGRYEDDGTTIRYYPYN